MHNNNETLHCHKCQKTWDAKHTSTAIGADGYPLSGSTKKTGALRAHPFRRVRHVYTPSQCPACGKCFTGVSNGNGFTFADHKGLDAPRHDELAKEIKAAKKEPKPMPPLPNGAFRSRTPLALVAAIIASGGGF